ncbi:MAG: Mrp/NBP35 family ATP-binding protein [Agromyces sp.]
MTDVDRIRRAVGGVVDPELRRTLGELGMISRVELDDESVTVGVSLTIVGCPAANRIESEVRSAAQAAAPDRTVHVALDVMTAEQRTELVAQLRAGRDARTMPFTPDSLTRVIAVTSGKGGVGKSTVTVNLAVALAQLGFSVGLIDADVHGFSIPGLLGLAGASPTRVGDLIVPPEAHGVRAISIGMFLEDPDAPVAWRGPMLHRTIQQFLTDVFFGDLDILLIDLPPGTGDIAISLGQLLPHAEVVVVTTPQAAAADVAARSGQVARQTGQQVRGVIENMAGLVQPDGLVLEIFGSGGGSAVATRLGAPLLGQIPLSIALRAGGDLGIPVVSSEPADPAAHALLTIATELSRRPESLHGHSLPIQPK